MKNKEIKGELAFASSLLILGLVVLYDTKNMLVPPASGTIGPQIFPYLVCGFLIFVSIGIIIQILRGNLGQPEGTEFGDTIDKTDFKTVYENLCYLKLKNKKFISSSFIDDWLKDKRSWAAMESCDAV